MTYGIYDIVDHVWIGTEEGPVLYDDAALAVCAARIVDVRLGTTAGRHRALPWHDGPVHRRDTVDTKMDTLEALTRLEEGRV